MSFRFFIKKTNSESIIKQEASIMLLETQTCGGRGEIGTEKERDT